MNSVEYLDSLRGFTASTYPPEPIDTTTIDTSSTGIMDFLIPEDVLVHPNPFTDAFQLRLNLTSGADLHIQLLDITGKLVADLGRKRFPAGNQLSSYNLNESVNPGLYHLVITDSNGGRLVKKVMRQ